MQFFTIHHRSKKSRARLGTIHTDHGDIQTPSFVPCATKGTLKGIDPTSIPSLGVEIMFVNTYHLVSHPGSEVVKKQGGIHRYAQFPTALMSDSGGFQVFSLAQNTKNKRRSAKLRGSEEEPLLIKISEDGAQFRSVYDGAVINFTPERSIEFQKEIGADLVMAFDECTYYPATHAYAEKSMKRTHEWLLRCIEQMKKNTGEKPTKNQYLYGIIQGGQFEDLRKKSAEFISRQDTAGVAIGGVSVGEGKQEMRDQVTWCAPYLPEDKPVHLLGVGHFDDLRDLVVHGIDTFDCVDPTRMARMGYVYQWNGEKTEYIEIVKSAYLNDSSALDTNCPCSVCTRFSKSYLHHLFKQKELLAYSLATQHNIFTLERYMAVLRDEIAKDRI